MRAVVLASGLALLVTGCSVALRYPYHLAKPLVKREGTVAVAVAVQDQRDSVLAGGRPDFVGVRRGLLGSREDITTVSGQPLAADVSTCVRQGLQEAGYQAMPVKVMIRSRPEYVVAQMAKTGAQRLLLVSIDAWKSDSFWRTWLFYDITVQVFDPEGKRLGRAATSGRDRIVGDDETELAYVYALKLQLLLNDRAVARALYVAPPSAPEPPAQEPVVPPAPTP
jgi:hypothetical protein